MSAVPDVQRIMLFRSGNCNFTSAGEDFVYEGITYEPGILVPGEHSDSVDGTLVLIPKACERIISDRNLGDHVFVDIIQRDKTQESGFGTSPGGTSLGPVKTITYTGKVPVEPDITIGGTGWYTTSTHWYILGAMDNTGNSKWEIKLLHPKSILNKGENLYWSDEFTRRKYNNDPWFENLSIIEDQVFKINLD